MISILSKKASKSIMLLLLISTVHCTHPWGYSDITGWCSSGVTSVADTIKSSFQLVKESPVATFAVGALCGTAFLGVPYYFQWKNAKKQEAEAQRKKDIKESNAILLSGLVRFNQGKEYRKHVQESEEALTDLRKIRGKVTRLINDRNRAKSALEQSQKEKEALQDEWDQLEVQLGQERSKREFIERQFSSFIDSTKQDLDLVEKPLNEGEDFGFTLILSDDEGTSESTFSDSNRIVRIIENDAHAVIDEDALRVFFEDQKHIALEDALKSVKQGGKIVHLIHENTVAFRRYLNGLSYEKYLTHINHLMYFLYAEAVLRGEVFSQGTFVVEDSEGKLNNFLMCYVNKVNPEAINGEPLYCSYNDKAYCRKATHFMGWGYGIDIDRLSTGPQRLPDGKPHVLFGHTDTTKKRIFIKPEDHGIYAYDPEGFPAHATGLGKSLGRKAGLWGSNEAEGMAKEHFPAAYKEKITSMQEAGIIDGSLGIVTIAQLYKALSEVDNKDAIEWRKELVLNYRHYDKRKGQEVYYTVDDLLPSAYCYHAVANKDDIACSLMDHLSNVYRIYQDVVTDLGGSGVFKAIASVDFEYSDLPETIEVALKQRKECLTQRAVLYANSLASTLCS